MASRIPLEAAGKCSDQPGTIHYEGGPLSPTVDVLTSTIAGSGSLDSSKVLSRQQSTESLSDLWAPRQCAPEMANQMEEDISVDKLFNLDEDDIKEIRRSSFIHSVN